MRFIAFSKSFTEHLSSASYYLRWGGYRGGQGRQTASPVVLMLQGLLPDLTGDLVWHPEYCQCAGRLGCIGAVTTGSGLSNQHQILLQMGLSFHWAYFVECC